MRARVTLLLLGTLLLAVVFLRAGLTRGFIDSLRSQGSDAELKSLDAWQMENIL